MFSLLRDYPTLQISVQCRVANFNCISYPKKYDLVTKMWNKKVVHSFWSKISANSIHLCRVFFGGGEGGREE